MGESVYVRASRGADFLDMEVPGWYDRVNPDALDISDCNNCVLGQLYGHFSLGLYYIDPVKAFSYGFADYFGGLRDFISVDEMTRRMSEAFMPLTQAWREQVIARQRRDIFVTPPNDIEELV